MRPAHAHDVAVLAPLATPLYVEGPTATAGGAEVQMFMTARALADAGLRVCHVVFADERLPERSDGVDLIPQASEDVYRHFTIFAASTARALARADAAVYVQRSAAFETGVVGAYARAARRRFVFSSSSDSDFTGEATAVTRAVRTSYRLGIRLADEVVVQTERQRELAEGVASRPAHVIRSFCQPADVAAGERDAFLWIGGLIDYKDPLAVVELAERVPEARFRLLGTPRGASWDHLERAVRDAGSRLPNLELLEPRPRAEVLELYQRAVAVVNTSRFEGFPNTFLEGWARGAPALSLAVDPDGVIGRHGLGHCAAGSIDRLADAARSMWARRGSDRAAATAAVDYVRRFHAPEVVARDWIDVVGGAGDARPR